MELRGEFAGNNSQYEYVNSRYLDKYYNKSHRHLRTRNHSYIANKI